LPSSLMCCVWPENAKSTVPAAAFSPSPTTTRSTFTEPNTHSGGSVRGGKCGRNPCLWDPKHDLSGASQCRLTTVATVGIRVMEVTCMLTATVAIQVTEVACCPLHPLSH
jgi:hypothetical protein